MTRTRRQRKSTATRQGKRWPRVLTGLCLVALLGAFALHSTGYAGALFSGIKGRLEARISGNGPGYGHRHWPRERPRHLLRATSPARPDPVPTRVTTSKDIPPLRNLTVNRKHRWMTTNSLASV